jgi:hypothetical protein
VSGFARLRVGSGARQGAREILRFAQNDNVVGSSAERMRDSSLHSRCNVWAAVCVWLRAAEHSRRRAADDEERFFASLRMTIVWAIARSGRGILGFTYDGNVWAAACA